MLRVVFARCFLTGGPPSLAVEARFVAFPFPFAAAAPPFPPFFFPFPFPVSVASPSSYTSPSLYSPPLSPPSDSSSAIEFAIDLRPRAALLRPTAAAGPDAATLEDIVEEEAMAAEVEVEVESEGASLPSLDRLEITLASRCIRAGLC